MFSSRACFASISQRFSVQSFRQACGQFKIIKPVDSPALIAVAFDFMEQDTKAAHRALCRINHPDRVDLASLQTVETAEPDGIHIFAIGVGIDADNFGAGRCLR